jgi:hypothetical protein
MKVLKFNESEQNNYLSEEDFEKAYNKFLEAYQEIHLHVFKLGRKLTPDQINMLEDISFKRIIDNSENNK